MSAIPDFLSDADPNAVGEFLRDVFFNQANGQEIGCYTTFDLRPFIHDLGEKIEEMSWGESVRWTYAEFEGITMRWYWDGDGVLEFHLPDGRIYQNNDCKKDRYWELVGPESVF